MTAYQKLLRDPRWQRKRLEILQRDEWTCQRCRSTTDELQVHHVDYVSGRKPWEYENAELQTLCDGCHFKEGFKLLQLDLAQPEDPEAVEWSLWFRAQAGFLAEGANNGAYCWDEPDQRKPNARVSRECVSRGFPSGEIDAGQRFALVSAAVDSLIANLATRAA